jgi:hypothetical protein
LIVTRPIVTNTNNEHLPRVSVARCMEALTPSDPWCLRPLPPPLPKSLSSNLVAFRTCLLCLCPFCWQAAQPKVTSVDELAHNLYSSATHFQVWMDARDVWVMRAISRERVERFGEDGTVGALVGDTAVLQRDLVAGWTSWFRRGFSSLINTPHIQSSSLCSELAMNEYRCTSIYSLLLDSLY